MNQRIPDHVLKWLKLNYGHHYISMNIQFFTHLPWHLDPSHRLGHLHLNVPLTTVHMPPCWHGYDEQGLLVPVIR